jgi:hypothetical protein
VAIKEPPFRINTRRKAVALRRIISAGPLSGNLEKSFPVDVSDPIGSYFIIK